MKALSEKCHTVTLIIFDRQLNLKAFFLNPISSVTTGGWTFGINFTAMPFFRLNPNEWINFRINRFLNKKKLVLKSSGGSDSLLNRA